MNDTHTHKKCPRCQAVSVVHATICSICGHKFRTQSKQSEAFTTKEKEDLRNVPLPDIPFTHRALFIALSILVLVFLIGSVYIFHRNNRYIPDNYADVSAQNGMLTVTNKSYWDWRNMTVVLNGQYKDIGGRVDRKSSIGFDIDALANDKNERFNVFQYVPAAVQVDFDVPWGHYSRTYPLHDEGPVAPSQ